MMKHFCLHLKFIIEQISVFYYKFQKKFNRRRTCFLFNILLIFWWKIWISYLYKLKFPSVTDDKHKFQLPASNTWPNFTRKFWTAGKICDRISRRNLFIHNMSNPNFHMFVNSTRHFHTRTTFFQPPKFVSSTRQFNINPWFPHDSSTRHFHSQNEVICVEWTDLCWTDVWNWRICFEITCGTDGFSWLKRNDPCVEVTCRVKEI